MRADDANSARNWGRSEVVAGGEVWLHLGLFLREGTRSAGKSQRDRILCCRFARILPLSDKSACVSRQSPLTNHFGCPCRAVSLGDYFGRFANGFICYWQP